MTNSRYNHNGNNSYKIRIYIIIIDLIINIPKSIFLLLLIYNFLLFSYL